MDKLFDVLMTNAMMGALMAAIVAAASRLPAIKRRPLIGYLLWMVVLTKLIAPPIFEIPVIDPIARQARAEHAGRPVSSRPAGQVTLHGQVAAAAFRGNEVRNRDWKPWFFGLSLCGTLALLSATGVQTTRLNRALRNSESTDPRIQRVARDAAKVVGLERAPEVSIVAGRVPPLLWFWRRSPVVVLPRRLADTLSDNQLRAVIVHEYVHYARRDYWTAAASFAVVAIVWWNPIAWWARREFRSLQEVLCDTHVLKREPDSRSTYARTLLKTLDFLQGEPAPAFPLASSFGAKSFTKRRFDMIASPHVSSQLSKGGSLALCCGIAVLVCTPAWAEEDAVDLKNCPDKVQKAIQAEAAGGQILEVEREKSESGVVFEADIKIDDNVYEVVVNGDGKLLSKELDDEDDEAEAKEDADHEDGDHQNADEEEEDEHEQAVTMKELPKAVRATLKRESRGGEVEELEREIKKGRVIYSADVEFETEAGEFVYDVEIAENGVLLRKILEDVEQDEEHGSHHDADDEEHERHEHHGEE